MKRILICGIFCYTALSKQEGFIIHIMKENKGLQKFNELNSWQLFAMTASMVMTVYGFAPFAKEGPTALFFLFLAGIFWFTPVTRAAGEMASINGWSKGGVFTWTSNMLGEKSGWAALFYQWIHITVGMDAMMYFIIGCFSMVFDLPLLNNNPLVRFVLMMIILWTIILCQQHGTKRSGKIAQWCFSLGVILPVIFLLVLFVAYLVHGNQVYVHVSWKTVIPHSFNGTVLVGFVPFMLAFAGAEGSAAHVKDLKKTSSYPTVMLALSIAAIVSDIVGSMSIAMTVPNNRIHLSTGIVYAYGELVKHIGFTPVYFEKMIGLMLAIGAIGEISSWVVGPNQGMFEAAKKGFLPARFGKTNKFGVPTKVMVLQGSIVSITAALFTFSGGKNADLAFDMAMSSTVAQYTLMYMLLFVSYLVLQFKHADLHRTYFASKHKFMRLLYGFFGLGLSAFGFVVTFFPTAGMDQQMRRVYTWLLLATCFLVFVTPFILYKFHYRWSQKTD